MKDTDQQ